MRQKEELRSHLFNTLRMYMLKDSQWNRYNDVILYYSLDQDKFLKRSQRTIKPVWNWIEIKHDVTKMFLLKSQLGLENKEHLTLSGRMTAFGRHQDDLWHAFMNYFEGTFESFWTQYTKLNQINEEPKQQQHSRLF